MRRRTCGHRRAAQTLAAQLRLPSLQGKNNSWFCGAYTRYGFHEDGLLSAVTMAQGMGVAIPWH
jgi:predicted NAD/FAD-binding protein